VPMATGRGTGGARSSRGSAGPIWDRLGPIWVTWAAVLAPALVHGARPGWRLLARLRLGTPPATASSWRHGASWPLVAWPLWAAPGCAGGYLSSFIFPRVGGAGDLLRSRGVPALLWRDHLGPILACGGTSAAVIDMLLLVDKLPSAVVRLLLVSFRRGVVSCPGESPTRRCRCGSR
jgi:hypothetical protein